MASMLPESGSLQLQSPPREDEDLGKLSRLTVLPKHNINVPDEQYGWFNEENHLEKQNSPSERPLNLQFVSETGTARPKGVSRNIIRSHVRRNKTGNSKPSRQVADFSTDAPLNEIERKAYKRGNRDTRTITEQNSTGREVEVRLPGLRPIVLEPFDSLPVGSSRHMQSLLNHWDTVFRHSCAPASPRDQWLEFAVSDALVLNTTCYVSALNLCGLRGQVLSPDVIYYQGQTIGLINKRLRDLSQLASDAMICAVGSLAHLENLAGTPASAKMHMDGLEIMVKSRGGLNVFGRHSLPRRMSAWADSCAAIVLHSKPRFENIGVDLVGELAERTPFSPLALHYRSKLLNLTRSQALSSATADIYWDIHSLSRVKDEASWGTRSIVSFEPCSDRLEILERRAIALVQDTALLAPTQDLVICKVFGYAVLIHSYGFLHDLALTLPFFNTLSQRIRHDLELVDITKLEMQYPEMMLWILMMGGIGGFELTERKWFAALLAELCLALGIHEGKGIALMLEEFLWSELYLSPATMGFWRKVAKAQGFEGAYPAQKLADHVSVAIFNAAAPLPEEADLR